MLRRRYRRYLLSALLAGALVVTLAPAAQAHGERAQEAFLRMRTVSWVDVNFSSDRVRQGETFTITGTAKILDAWPTNLAKGNPNTAFLGIIAPGPVVMLKERTINGVSVPTRIDAKKGDIYEFSMTVAGRRVGKWHVHPALSVKGAGTLLGPGQFINVEENPDGFRNDVTLVKAGGETGGTINLENYQLTFTWVWLVITFLIGLAWMIYWTVPKRTVTNLAVTSQIPLNTDGMDYGLITKKDHRNMNWFAIGTALLLLVGWIWQANAFPTKMPQQIFQFAPPRPAVAETSLLGTAGLASARYDQGSQTLTMDVDVTNRGTTPMELQQFTTSTLKFAPGLTPGENTGGLVATPAASVAPGATTKLSLAMQGPGWEDEKLIPVNESSQMITGILVFQTADGKKVFTEVEANLQPILE
jgi:methane/ammonia monooxygenase subunit B